MDLTSLKQLRSALIAASYDLMMNRTERCCLSEWRRELLVHAQGQVLEIGAGTGLNIPYYCASKTQVTLSEPDTHMRKKLEGKIQRKNKQTATIRTWPAEQLDMPDNSYDTIVSTLVLCSVTCQATSLKEIRRLLKPGGQLIFLEHVISDKPKIRRWQKLLEPTWRLCAGDCRLTRDTHTAIETAGFLIEKLIEAPMLGTPAFVSKTIRGVARKPLTETES